MKKAVSMGAMALLALAAFAPAAGAQEEVVDADAIIEEVQAEAAADGFFEEDFFTSFFGDSFFGDSFFGFDGTEGAGDCDVEADGECNDTEEIVEGGVVEGSEDAPSPEAATAGDGQYDPEADSTGGLTPEERAEGNMEEPPEDNLPLPTQP